MNIHEFQAKLILQKYGVPIPEFFVASNLEEVKQEIQERNWQEAVLKVQVQAGGRGKAGGVKIAHNQEEILLAAQELLGKTIINEQTGPKGLIAYQILVSPLVPILQEYYLGLAIDRKQGQQILIASPAGGVDIEQVIRLNPEKVLKMVIPLEGRLKSYHFLRLAKFMGWKGALAEQGKLLITSLIQAFTEIDASLLEINPLIETKDHRLLALDAKVNLDDNALFRHPDLKSFFDPSQVSLQENLAHQADLAYVALDGNIGCMVNGAGLAMATLDIIQYYGGKPANFLDIGGGASKEKVIEGFKIILADKQVKVVLVNIFGGIMNCEILVLGLIEAIQASQTKIPLVVRMEGTGVEQGKQRLQESGLEIIIAVDLADAAQKAVAMAKVEEADVYSH